MFSARPLQQTNGSQWPICTSSIKQPTMFWFHGQFCPGLRAAALPTREICHNLGKERQRRRGRQRKNTLRYKGCWQGQLVTGHSFHVLSSSQSGKIWAKKSYTHLRRPSMTCSRMKHPRKMWRMWCDSKSIWHDLSHAPCSQCCSLMGFAI